MRYSQKIFIHKEIVITVQIEFQIIYLSKCVIYDTTVTKCQPQSKYWNIEQHNIMLSSKVQKPLYKKLRCLRFDIPMQHSDANFANDAKILL